VVQIPIAARDFFPSPKGPDMFGAPPASYSKDTGIHSHKSSSQGITFTIHHHQVLSLRMGAAFLAQIGTNIALPSKLN